MILSRPRQAFFFPLVSLEMGKIYISVFHFSPHPPWPCHSLGPLFSTHSDFSTCEGVVKLINDGCFHQRQFTRRCCQRRLRQPETDICRPHHRQDFFLANSGPWNFVLSADSETEEKTVLSACGLINVLTLDERK